jgi:uncharacterized membrane protein YvlD (DUF360 family)
VGQRLARTCRSASTNFFWDAIFGAIIITLVSWVLNVVLPEND